VIGARLDEPMCPKTRAQLSTGDFVRGIEHTIVLKARDDLFDPSTGDDIVLDNGKTVPGLQLCVNDEITAIPDNVGCCEVVSVGCQVVSVKPGDVVFIDFFDVRQGAVLGDPESLKGIELYIANDDAIKAYFDQATRTITPLPGYLIVKKAPERMAVAMVGTDRLTVPDATLKWGIVSGRSEDGTPYAFVRYDEVVSCGAPEHESPHRKMTRAERDLLNEIESRDGAFGQASLDAFMAERRHRSVPVKPGDLVAFSTEFSVEVRVRGEFVKIVPQSALLCVIDDGKVLDTAIRAGKAGKLVRL
jgi:hypothetical protein